MTDQPAYCNIKVLQWLLAVTLTFSAISFAGFGNYSHARDLQPDQTELVESKQEKVSARPVLLFASALKLCNSFIQSREYKSRILFVQNMKVKELLISVSEHLYSFQPLSHFLPVKIIPQSPDNDFPPSSISGS
ncbi:MAG: hypothetical protein WEA56_09680 [Balneolaceae bacterium]